MKLNFTQETVIATRIQRSDPQVTISQPERNAETARLDYLRRRFAPHIAAIVAPICFGEGTRQ